jgi:hypothetical protein
MSRRTPQRSGATAKSAKRLSRNRILGIMAAVVVLILVIIGLVINSRFCNRRCQAAPKPIDTVVSGKPDPHSSPRRCSSHSGARLTTVMPRTLDTQQLINEIAAVAIEFDLEIIDTDLALGKHNCSPGRETSYGDQLVSDLGFSDLRERRTCRARDAALVSVTGTLGRHQLVNDSAL